MFSLVGHDLGGQRILDAFGGSGLLGLEAWSRGATVTIVEKHPRAVASIRRNVAGLGAEVEVRRGDALSLADVPPFDLVLADPPYAFDRGRVLTGLAPLVAGRLLLEGDMSGEAAEADGLVMVRERCYGGTRLWLYEREEPG